MDNKRKLELAKELFKRKKKDEYKNDFELFAKGRPQSELGGSENPETGTTPPHIFFIYKQRLNTTL